MRAPALCLAAILSLVASSASADEDYDRCMVNARSLNISWGTCGEAWIDREETRLNAIWDRVMAKASRQTRDSLIVEQGKWLEFKHRACQFFSLGEWGRDGTLMHEPRCKAHILRERSEFLTQVDASLAR